MGRNTGIILKIPPGIKQIEKSLINNTITGLDFNR